MYQKAIDKILAAHGDYITGSNDLTADKKPSIFFYLFGRAYSHVLCDEPDEAALRKAIRWRRHVNPLLKKLVPVSMKAKQVFENRNELRGLPGKDEGVSLPDKPVIWASTHLF